MNRTALRQPNRLNFAPEDNHAELLAHIRRQLGGAPEIIPPRYNDVAREEIERRQMNRYMQMQGITIGTDAPNISPINLHETRRNEILSRDHGLAAHFFNKKTVNANGFLIPLSGPEIRKLFVEQVQRLSQQRVAAVARATAVRTEIDREIEDIRRTLGNPDNPITPGELRIARLRGIWDIADNLVRKMTKEAVMAGDGGGLGANFENTLNQLLLAGIEYRQASDDNTLDIATRDVFEAVYYDAVAMIDIFTQGNRSMENDVDNIQAQMRSARANITTNWNTDVGVWNLQQTQYSYVQRGNAGNTDLTTALTNLDNENRSYWVMAFRWQHEIRAFMKASQTWGWAALQKLCNSPLFSKEKILNFVATMRDLVNGALSAQPIVGAKSRLPRIYAVSQTVATLLATKGIKLLATTIVSTIEAVVKAGVWLVTIPMIPIVMAATAGVALWEDATHQNIIAGGEAVVTGALDLNDAFVTGVVFPIGRQVRHSLDFLVTWTTNHDYRELSRLVGEYNRLTNLRLHNKFNNLTDEGLRVREEQKSIELQIANIKTKSPAFPDVNLNKVEPNVFEKDYDERHREQVLGRAERIVDELEEAKTDAMGNQVDAMGNIVKRAMTTAMTTEQKITKAKTVKANAGLIPSVADAIQNVNRNMGPIAVTTKAGMQTYKNPRGSSNDVELERLLQAQAKDPKRVAMMASLTSPPNLLDPTKLRRTREQTERLRAEQNIQNAKDAEFVAHIAARLNRESNFFSEIGLAIPNEYFDDPVLAGEIRQVIGSSSNSSRMDEEQPQQQLPGPFQPIPGATEIPGQMRTTLLDQPPRHLTMGDYNAGLSRANYDPSHKPQKEMEPDAAANEVSLALNTLPPLPPIIPAQTTIALIKSALVTHIPNIAPMIPAIPNDVPTIVSGTTNIRQNLNQGLGALTPFNRDVIITENELPIIPSVDLLEPAPESQISRAQPAQPVQLPPRRDIVSNVVNNMPGGENDLVNYLPDPVQQRYPVAQYPPWLKIIIDMWRPNTPFNPGEWLRLPSNARIFTEISFGHMPWGGGEQMWRRFIQYPNTLWAWDRATKFSQRSYWSAYIYAIFAAVATKNGLASLIDPRMVISLGINLSAIEKIAQGFFTLFGDEAGNSLVLTETGEAFSMETFDRRQFIPMLQQFNVPRVAAGAPGAPPPPPPPGAGVIGPRDGQINIPPQALQPDPNSEPTEPIDSSGSNQSATIIDSNPSFRLIPQIQPQIPEPQRNVYPIPLIQPPGYQIPNFNPQLPPMPVRPQYPYNEHNGEPDANFRVRLPNPLNIPRHQPNLPPLFPISEDSLEFYDFYPYYDYAPPLSSFSISEYQSVVRDNRPVQPGPIPPPPGLLPPRPPPLPPQPYAVPAFPNVPGGEPSDDPSGSNSNTRSGTRSGTNSAMTVEPYFVPQPDPLASLTTILSNNEDSIQAQRSNIGSSFISIILFFSQNFQNVAIASGSSTTHAGGW